MNLTWKTNVSFGGAVGRTRDRISGHYVRDRQYESADIHIRRLEDGRYHVKGAALFGTHLPGGPRTGDLEFIADLAGHTLEFRDTWADQTYRATLTFADGHLVISEEGRSGTCGMGVTFSGEYERAN